MKRACPYCARPFHLAGIARHAETCASRPGPRPKPPAAPRYGAWWAGGWFNHTRQGVRALGTVAELLAGAKP